MDGISERPSRQSAHLARQRQLFLRSAAQTLSESGLNATIDQFASAAGVTVATLYNHFPSKDALIQLAFTQAVNEWEEWMLATVAGLNDPAERLVCSFRLFLRVPSTHSDFSGIASLGVSAGAPVVMVTADNAIREINALNQSRNVSLTVPEKRFQSFFASLLAELQQQSVVADEQAADAVVELLLPLLGFSSQEAHELVGRPLPAS